MLVPTRRPAESVRITPSKALDSRTTVAEPFANGPIEVSVAGMENGRLVRIAIRADRRLVILRNELDQYE